MSADRETGTVPDVPDDAACSAGVSAPEKVWTQNMLKDAVPEGVRKIYERIGITVGPPKLNEQDDPRLEPLLVGLYSLPNETSPQTARKESQ